MSTSANVVSLAARAGGTLVRGVRSVVNPSASTAGGRRRLDVGVAGDHGPL